MRRGRVGHLPNDLPPSCRPHVPVGWAWHRPTRPTTGGGRPMRALAAALVALAAAAGGEEAHAAHLGTPPPGAWRVGGWDGGANAVDRGLTRRATKAMARLAAMGVNQRPFAMDLTATQPPRNVIEELVQELHAAASAIPGVRDAATAEWWFAFRQPKAPAAATSMHVHFDKEEEALGRNGTISTPTLASVFYLDDAGGATVVSDAHVSCCKGAGACAATPGAHVDGMCAPHAAFIVPPSSGDYLVFDGALAHGVLPPGHAYAQEACGHPSDAACIAAVSSTTANSPRAALLINYWAGAAPAGLERSPPTPPADAAWLGGSSRPRRAPRAATCALSETTCRASNRTRAVALVGRNAAAASLRLLHRLHGDDAPVPAATSAAELRRL